MSYMVDQGARADVVDPGTRGAMADPPPMQQPQPPPQPLWQEPYYPHKKSWERTEDSETLPGPDSGSGWHSGAMDGGRLEGAVDGGINFPADGGLE